MNAIDLLKKQHMEVSDLFARFAATSDKAEKRAIFEKVATALVSHDAIEREIFYPACEKEMGKSELLGESVVEHGVIEFMIHRADLNSRKEAFDDYIKVLKEMVRHHVDEEEDELFPKVQRALSQEKLEKLGIKMWARFHEASANDFRPALAATLKQVIAGATETKPPKKKAAPKPKAKVKAKAKAKPAARSSRSRANGHASA
jgi:hypothetical protein